MNGLNGTRRTLAGEDHPMAKLTEAQARQLRQRVRNGERVVLLVAEYGIQQAQIYRIKLGQRWRILDQRASRERYP